MSAGRPAIHLRKTPRREDGSQTQVSGAIAVDWDLVTTGGSVAGRIWKNRDGWNARSTNGRWVVRHARTRAGCLAQFTQWWNSMEYL